jgi:hypothetical protein
MTVNVTPIRHERKVAEEVRCRNVKMIKAAYGSNTYGGHGKLIGPVLAKFLHEAADVCNRSPQKPDQEFAARLRGLATPAKRGPLHALKAIAKETHPWADPAQRGHAYAYNVYLMLLVLGDGSLDRASSLVAADFGIPGTTLNDAARKVSNAYLDCFRENPKWLSEIRTPRTLGEACVSHCDPMEEWLMNGCLEKVPTKDVVNPLTADEWDILMPHLRSGHIIPWPRGRSGAIRKKWFTADDAKAFEQDPTNWLIPGAPAVPWRLLPGLTLK